MSNQTLGTRFTRRRLLATTGALVAISACSTAPVGAPSAAPGVGGASAAPAAQGGTVKLTAHDDAGREVAIAILRGGDVFGELELFDADIPRSVTVTAITETQALALDRRDFFDVLERHPRAMRLMLTSLARTIRDTARRIEDLVFLDLPSRVAKALLDLRTTHGANGEIHLTQDDIAAFVGATRASVNRVLSDLEGQGIIGIGRRQIEIKDLARLQRQIRY